MPLGTHLNLSQMTISPHLPTNRCAFVHVLSLSFFVKKPYRCFTIMSRGNTSIDRCTIWYRYTTSAYHLHTGHIRAYCQELQIPFICPGVPDPSFLTTRICFKTAYIELWSHASILPSSAHGVIQSAHWKWGFSSSSNMSAYGHILTFILAMSKFRYLDGLSGTFRLCSSSLFWTNDNT